MKTHVQIRVLVVGVLLMVMSLWSARGQNSSSSFNLPVTNLFQLVQLLNSNQRVVRDVQLEAVVCATGGSGTGVIILQDATDAELIEFEGSEPEILPGDRIRIDQKNCLLRRRDMGVEISALPVVDNDGLHAKSTGQGNIALKAGRHPLTLEWFNRVQNCYLEVKWQIPGSQPQEILGTNFFWRAAREGSAETIFQSGLRAECYVGDWQQIPDFDLLKPARSGIVTNFDLTFKTQDQFTGLRFRGFFDAPVDGVYTFNLDSADGSLLFIGDPAAPITKIGREIVPKPKPVAIDETITNSNEQRWVVVEGHVSSISSAGQDLELKLDLPQSSILVRVADSNEFDIADLLNAQVRVAGVENGSFNLRGEMILGELFVANAKSVEILNRSNAHSQPSSSFVKIEQVQNMPLKEARRHLPIHIQGVVTSVGRISDHPWFSVQDTTRGIFVNLAAISNSPPVCGDFYEIIGHSDVGEFAPVVVADQIIRLGKGELPKPAHPTWNGLVNGSMDVQWVEFGGVVTGVRSNALTMFLPDKHQIEVQVERQARPKLSALKNSVVQICGVLRSLWNTNREVKVGAVVIRNISMTVEIPAPTNPFDAVLKTPRDLLHFDAQASPFRRVKVQGQIIYADASQIFLTEDGAGLRILPAEKSDVHVGDLVEAAGYPDIGETALFLREAQLRKTGETSLPSPKKLAETELMQTGLDSTRVRVEGKLLGWHLEQGSPVLEMQSGMHSYLARLPSRQSVSWRTGSWLALDGVYVAHGNNLRPGSADESFELFLNSPMDVTVLSQPTWWTLQRLLIVVGVLLAILVFTVIWITQLQHLVEQRTAQLQRETRERERIERQHALEAERSRIARDLHDHLGSSLTEIGALANTGQRPQMNDSSHINLFHMIGDKARSLIAGLDVIVWAVDPEDDSLQSLADYLTGYTEEFFSNTKISYRFKIPVSFPEATVEGRVRHDLLMAVKETLNNIVRHAEATEVEFGMTVVDGNLKIEISDHGKGFECGTNGHGLKNLSVRLLKLGGTCTIESRVGGGTRVNICLPLPTSVGRN